MGLFGFSKKRDILVENISTNSVNVKNKSNKAVVTDSKKILTEKIFANGRTLDSNGLTMLPNPSTILEQIDTTQAELFEDMFNDDHIFAVTEILVAGVLRNQYKITSTMESEALRLTNLFKKLPISDTIENIIYGKLKGMAVFELVWGFNNGSGYYLKDIVPLDATKIAVNGKNEIIYDNLYNVSDEKYKYKFIVYRNKSYQNPYGVAEILKCYYAWLFKKAGWKFWMVTTEKYSVPTLIVNFDPSEIDDPQLKADELATAFYNIQSDAVIVTNGLSDKNGIVKLDVNAKADEFRTLINKAEEAISKVIIGTHVLMDGTSGGSRSLAEVAANINFRYKVQALIIEVCSVFNKLLILESELQTGKENPYNNEFTIPYVNIQDWEKTREAITLGIPVSKKSIYYHVDKPIDDEDIFVQEPKVTSVAYDHPNITDEKDADTDDTRGRKTIPKKQETREATKDTGK